jgi:hypothetical protein
MRSTSVSQELNSFSFNTAIAQTMIFVNDSPARNASLLYSPRTVPGTPTQRTEFLLNSATPELLPHICLSD